MDTTTLVARSGTFPIGGDLPVHRLGFGAMRLTGAGVWGEPADPDEAVRVLRRAIERGVNLYNLADRSAEPVLAHCEAHGLGFIPWFPLAMGELAKPGGALAAVAEQTGAAPGQLALAWLLARSPVILPIPGTSTVAHLEENLQAAALELTAEQVQDLADAA